MTIGIRADHLLKLRATGHSCAEIGKLLSVSSQVVSYRLRQIKKRAAREGIENTFFSILNTTNIQDYYPNNAIMESLTDVSIEGIGEGGLLESMLALVGKLDSSRITAALGAASSAATVSSETVGSDAGASTPAAEVEEEEEEDAGFGGLGEDYFTNNASKESLTDVSFENIGEGVYKNLLAKKTLNFLNQQKLEIEDMKLKSQEWKDKLRIMENSLSGFTKAFSNVDKYLEADENRLPQIQKEAK